MLNAVFSFYDWLIENKEVMGDGPDFGVLSTSV